MFYVTWWILVDTIGMSHLMWSVARWLVDCRQNGVYVLAAPFTDVNDAYRCYYGVFSMCVCVCVRVCESVCERDYIF